MSGAIRFVVIVGSTGLYFGLAILGWGGFAAFFAHPARTALAVATLPWRWRRILPGEE